MLASAATGSGIVPLLVAASCLSDPGSAQAPRSAAAAGTGAGTRPQGGASVKDGTFTPTPSRRSTPGPGLRHGQPAARSPKRRAPGAQGGPQRPDPLRLSFLLPTRKAIASGTQGISTRSPAPSYTSAGLRQVAPVRRNKAQRGSSPAATAAVGPRRLPPRPRDAGRHPVRAGPGPRHRQRRQDHQGGRRYSSPRVARSDQISGRREFPSSTRTARTRLLGSEHRRRSRAPVTPAWGHK